MITLNKQISPYSLSFAATPKPPEKVPHNPQEVPAYEDRGDVFPRKEPLKNDPNFFNPERNEKKLNELKDQGVTIVAPETTWISDETKIAKGEKGKETIIYPGTYIQGKNNIGANNSIGPNAFIGGDVNTGDNVQIVQSNVSHTTLHDNVQVGPYSTIRDGSEMGKGTVIGTSSEIGYSKFGENVNARHLNAIFKTNADDNTNFGAGFRSSSWDGLTNSAKYNNIGKEALIGSGVTMLNPINVGDGALIGSGSVISKDVPALSLALARPKKDDQVNKEGWVPKQLNNLINNPKLTDPQREFAQNKLDRLNKLDKSV